MKVVFNNQNVREKSLGLGMIYHQLVHLVQWYSSRIAWIPRVPQGVFLTMSGEGLGWGGSR